MKTHFKRTHTRSAWHVVSTYLVYTYNRNVKMLYVEYMSVFPKQIKARDRTIHLSSTSNAQSLLNLYSIYNRCLWKGNFVVKIWISHCVCVYMERVEVLNASRVLHYSPEATKTPECPPEFKERHLSGSLNYISTFRKHAIVQLSLVKTLLTISSTSPCDCAMWLMRKWAPSMPGTAFLQVISWTFCTSK